MHTLGFRFKPWIADKAIADGPAILSYLEETAREHGIDEHIRYGKKVLGLRWTSENARWTADVQDSRTGETSQITASFIVGATGYYSYDEPFTPEFPGRDRYQGEFVHPQLWPEDLDYAGKKVVVIGSGATAVTLVPAMARGGAEHVTMLQRSPTYIVALPGKDPIANALRRVLPDKVAYGITRWKNVIVQAGFYQLARRRPKIAKAFIRNGVKRAVGPAINVDTHFKPDYDPWDQRVCLVPDGDLFRALRKGTAEIVTDHIETFTERGIKLKSGRELEADIVVSATGLNLVPIGDFAIEVDGEKVAINERMTYKALMLERVPNHVFCVGYTNASWTLKVDITCEYMTRLLAYMDEHGYTCAMPVNDDPSVGEEPFLDFTSGYVQRSLHKFPKQGDRAPWKLRQNYALDILTLRHGKIDDGVIRFSAPDREAASEREVVAA
jgi:cation diffusion facilitator CzcD-associated flavoprotein CzcO